jgi:hypothetical protein
MGSARFGAFRFLVVFALGSAGGLVPGTCEAAGGTRSSVYDASVTSGEIATSLSGHGLLPFQEGFREIPGFHVHQIFYSSDLKRALFLRFHVSTRSPIGQRIAAPGGSVFFDQDAAGTVYAAYLKGFSAEEEARIQATLQTKLSASRPHACERQWHWISEAEASESNAAASCYASSLATLSEDHAKSVRAIVEHVEASTYGPLALNCLSGALEGAWGEVKSMWDGAVTLVTDPMEYARSLGKAWDSLTEFVSDFRANLQKTFASIASLPTSAQAELLCGFLGGQGIPKIVALLAGGAGAALLMKDLATYFLRVARLHKLLKIVGNAPERLVAMKGFWRKLSSGAMSERRLEAIERLADVSDDLAMGAATCGI